MDFGVFANCLQKRLKNTVQNCFCTPLTSSRDSDDEYNHDKGDDYDDCDDDDHDNYDDKSFMHESFAMRATTTRAITTTHDYIR